MDSTTIITVTLVVLGLVGVFVYERIRNRHEKEEGN